MKHGIIFFILGLLIWGCFSCRSSRNSSLVDVRSESAQRTNISTATDSSRTTRDDSVFTVSIDTTRIYSIRVELDTAGRLRSIQKEWRDIGRTVISTGTGRSSAVSVGSSGSTVSENKQSNSKSETKTNNKTDSRPIQGHEWIYVSLAVASIIVITIALILKKK